MTRPLSAEKVYQRFQPHIAKSLKAKINCSSLREDLMQDFYLRLMRVEHWHSIENIDGYVKTIMNNLVLDYYRKSETHHTEEFNENDAQTSGCLEKSLIIEQTLEQIQNCVAKQKVEKQDLLWRSKVQGDNYQQIAKDKNRSVSWVEKSIAHITAQCKQIMQQKGQ